MALLSRIIFLVALSALTFSPPVVAQDRLEQRLLQASTSGLFNVNPLHLIMATMAPVPTTMPSAPLRPMPRDPRSGKSLASSLKQSIETSLEAAAELFSQVTLGMNLPPRVEPDAGPRLESSQAFSLDLEGIFLPSITPNVEPTVELILEFEEVMPSKSPVAILPETEFIGSPDGSTEASAVSSPFNSNQFDVEIDVFDPITVNCGSLDVRNTLGLDTQPWFNRDSYVISDPFAMTQFASFEEALLYSTHRYANGNLTYTVPLKSAGVWRLALQWAEISVYYMHEGSRVFSVNVNGIELDNEIDVYRDSPYGGYSPLLRTYIVEVQDSAIRIVLGQKVGQAMLSAFQITYMGPKLL